MGLIILILIIRYYENYYYLFINFISILYDKNSFINILCEFILFDYTRFVVILYFIL